MKEATYCLVDTITDYGVKKHGSHPQSLWGRLEACFFTL